MKPPQKNMKRCAGVFGPLILSVMILITFGGAITYTDPICFSCTVIASHEKGAAPTSIERTSPMPRKGAFASLAPKSPHDSLSILDLIGYCLGLGTSGSLLLVCGSVGLSTIGGILLVPSFSFRRLSTRPFRYLVVAAYGAAPILAVAVVVMLLYAVVTGSPTFF